jgi:glycosyltransferase involved in cell wall biosynthesis
MDHPLVTIAIPTYNRADGYLRIALESALSQTYPQVEVLVSDNCSSDGTPDLLRSIEDPRLVYHRHEQNIGAANNFNFCLEQARGRYFLLLSDDDMIDEDFVETCMERAAYSSDYAVIRTGIRIIDENGTVVHEAPNRVKDLPFEEFMLGWFNNRTAWYLCSTLFNTGKLRGIGGLRSRHNLLQDGVAIVKLASTGKRLDVEEVKASFRKHSGEITFAVKVRDWAEDFRDLLGLIRASDPVNGDLLEKEGKRFFSSLSYKRAAAVKDPINRWKAYFAVWRIFDHEYLPPPITRVLNKVGGFCGSTRSSGGVHP